MQDKSSYLADTRPGKSSQFDIYSPRQSATYSRRSLSAPPLGLPCEPLGSLNAPSEASGCSSENGACRQHRFHRAQHPWSRMPPAHPTPGDQLLPTGATEGFLSSPLDAVAPTTSACFLPSILGRHCQPVSLSVWQFSPAEAAEARVRLYQFGAEWTLDAYGFFRQLRYRRRWRRHCCSRWLRRHEADNQQSKRSD